VAAPGLRDAWPALFALASREQALYEYKISGSSRHGLSVAPRRGDERSISVRCMLDALPVYFV
jgi:hypothetical protein